MITNASAVKPEPTLLRLAVLSAAICLAMITTWLLALVREISADGLSCRQLWPAQFIEIITGALIATSILLGIFEFRGQFSFPVTIYLIFVILYFGFWWILAEVFTNDYVISISRPAL